MNFDEYNEFVIEDNDFISDFEVELAYYWTHPEWLPKRITKINKMSKVVRFPKIYVNYKIFRRVLEEPIGVAISEFSDDVFKENEVVTDIILNSYIVSIPPGAFSGCINLENIFIPRFIRSIRENTFKGCNKLKNIYYEGTKEEFEKIEVTYKKYRAIHKLGLYDDIEEYIVHGNEPFLNAKVHYNCKINDKNVVGVKTMIPIGLDSTPKLIK